jgi:ubiquitin C-terminal hydrolase
MFTSKLLSIMGGFAPNQSSSEYFLKLTDYCKIDKLFESHTETTTICMNCNHANKTKDTTSFFMIDNDFNEFTSSTRESEGFNCEACKQKVTVTISSKLVSVSPIMVFSFNKYFGKKNIFYPNAFVIDEDKTYSLFATIEHMGVLNAGHYFCRTKRNGNWFTIDDQRVTPFEKIEPLDSTYMVFYTAAL